MESNILQMLAQIGVALASWFLGAIIVVGLMQAIKTAIPAVDKGQPWLKTVVAVAVALLVGFARYLMATSVPPEGPVWTALGIVAVSQICYESIYRGILKRGAKFADAGDPASAPPVVGQPGDDSSSSGPQGSSPIGFHAEAIEAPIAEDKDEDRQ